MTLSRNLNLMTKLGIMLGATCVGLVAVAAVAMSNLTAIEDDWEEFVASSQVKQEAIAEMRSAAGYGGMIHDFKNYLLRRNQYYVDGTRRHGANALDAIDLYRGAGVVNASELDSLDQVQLMVESYLEVLDVAVSMFTDGATVFEVDAVVRIDDSPYVGALVNLSAELDAAIEAETTAVSDRVQSAKRLLWATIIPAAALALISGVAILRTVVGGLARIGDQAEAIASGDLGAEPLNMRGSDEITRLGDVFDEMTESLSLARDQLRRISVHDTSSEIFDESVPGELGDVINETTRSLSLAQLLGSLSSR